MSEKWKRSDAGKTWKRGYDKKRRAEKSLRRFTPEGRRRVEEYNRARLARLGVTGKESYWARKLKGPGLCETCGAGGRQEVHHVDGNQKNNAPENLERLCCVCHAARHRRAA